MVWEKYPVSRDEDEALEANEQKDGVPDGVAENLLFNFGPVLPMELFVT